MTAHQKEIDSVLEYFWQNITTRNADSGHKHRELAVDRAGRPLVMTHTEFYSH